MPDSLPIKNIPTRPIWIKVVTPLGEIPLTNVSVGNSVNRGREWSFTCPQFLDPYFGDTAGIFSIKIHDSINTYETPDLTIVEGRRGITMEGDSTTFSGIDLTTWVMTESDLVLGTFTQTNSVSLIAAVGEKTGIKVSGVESYNIKDEDANNQKMIEILSRVIEKSGQCWHVESNGNVSVCSNMTTAPRQEFLATQAEETVSYANKVDSIKIGKTSRTAGGAVTADEGCFRFDSIGFKSNGVFKVPLYNAVPYDRSLSGYIYYVTTFNGSPGNGTVTGRFKMVNDATEITGGVIDVSLPSTSFTCVVNLRTDLPAETPIDAKVCFTGRPQTGMTVDLEPTFITQIGIRQTSAPTNRTRPYRFVLVDTLYPSRVFAVNHAPNYLLEHNRNFRRWSASGPLDLGVHLFQKVKLYRIPEFVVDSYKHDISLPDNATTSINGIPTSMYEWCLANGVEIPITD